MLALALDKREGYWHYAVIPLILVVAFLWLGFVVQQALFVTAWVYRLQASDKRERNWTLALWMWEINCKGFRPTYKFSDDNEMLQVRKIGRAAGGDDVTSISFRLVSFRVMSSRFVPFATSFAPSRLMYHPPSPHLAPFRPDASSSPSSSYHSSCSPFAPTECWRRRSLAASLRT